MSRPIEPIGLLILFGIFGAIGIDVVFLSTHDIIVQIELLATLSIICILGLWYAGYEYYSLRDYQYRYHSITVLIPALNEEAAIKIVQQEFGHATALTQHLALLRHRRWTSEHPNWRELQRAEKSARKARAKYITLCTILHQSGFTIPPELALADPWQWKQMMGAPLPK